MAKDESVADMVLAAGKLVIKRDARIAALEAERDALRAQVEALQDRLEMRHTYDTRGNRIEVEPGTAPDGIARRDEAIAVQDERIAGLTFMLEALIEAGIGVMEWDKRRGYPIPYAVRDPLFAALAKPTGSPDGP